MLPPVIGVDLGASFTKVSYRPPWVDSDSYFETSQMVVIEGSPLVPSLVIYSVRNGKWLFGEEAAEYWPTAEDRVFSNWKAALYSQRLDHKVDGAMDAASRFFEWLGQQLRATGIPVNSAQIKICLPAFDGAAEPGKMLVERMKRCGWAGLEHATIEEPRANTVGMFGEGRNAAHRPDPNGEIFPNYMGNFPMGGFVLSHLRNYALYPAVCPRLVSYLIIDIGSFTADLSLAVLDAQRDGDCVRQATQHSFELGLVDHYERPLFGSLLQIKGLEWNDLNFNDRERVKNALNSDGEINIAVPNRGNVTFGTTEDRRAAEGLAEDFARQLATVIERFVEGDSVRHVILTGGGVAIEKLRVALRHHLETQGMNVLPQSGQGSAETLDHATSTVSWESTAETLERLATAIGASSVLMDLPVHHPPPAETAIPVQESPWIVCSCNGGNKGCATCGGLGMYLRES